MNAPKILVVRRDNIGDLVCTLPLIAALRCKFPKARLDVLVNSYCAAVMDGNPDIDHLYVYTKAKHRDAAQSALGVYWERLKTTLALRLTGYDYALLANVSCLPRPVRWARQVGAKQIVGFVEEGNPLAAQIDVPVPLPGHDKHEVERLMTLMQPFGGFAAIPALRIAAPQEDVAAQRRRLAQRGYAGGELLGFHISARLESQRWPVPQFIELAHQLNRERPQPIALFWSPGKADNPSHPGDDEKAAAILAGCGDLPIFPLHTEKLEELIAGLACVDRLFCSDGGAMHVAAALGKPIVCLFGESNAASWHPWGVPHVILQPESRRVEEVGVEAVFSAHEKLLKNNSPE
ncbi:MAG: glycosyltransferase family 9 protein [Sulfuricella sp.]|nr:glycosyltransferase family 9 protein [Sulfuricella sp.]